MVANSRAAARIVSAGTQVIGAAHSGVNCRTCVGEPVEAVRPFFDEGFVVEPVRDDHVDHGERERIVGTRPQLQP